MYTAVPFFTFINNTSINIRDALNSNVTDQNVSHDRLATELGIDVETLGVLLNATGPDNVELWVAIQDRLVEVLARYGVLSDKSADAAGAAEPTKNSVMVVHKESPGDDDPFGGSAEEIAAEETRHKVKLFAWADGVLDLSAAELELELDRAAKQFKMSKATLKALVKARRNEKTKRERADEHGPADAPEDNVRFYGRNFRVSGRGVFARRIDPADTPVWEMISSTRIDIEALTRDGRGENWGSYIVVTN